MEESLNFRIPMFTNKDSFMEFQYVELGEQIEYTLCGYNGEPQQCIGRKDKNGKFIFVGDIVIKHCIDTSPYSKTGIVIYDKNTTSFKIKVNKDYYETTHRMTSFDNTESYNDGYCAMKFDYEYEIIGNTYENRELLEK